MYFWVCLLGLYPIDSLERLDASLAPNRNGSIRHPTETETSGQCGWSGWFTVSLTQQGRAV